MSDNCQLVVFSNKAYNAIIRESFDKDPVETGGILLGHVLDNGVWIVMEVLPPGINSIFQYAYFEYDEAFVNYLAQSVANQYKRPLDLLGLWHRHPGNMDVFSSTDDGTNITFARQNPAGVISGLVNIDPKFRMTMYHLDMPMHRLQGRPDYNVVDVEVGDDIIPEEYFELRYYDGVDSNLHPTVSSKGGERQVNRNLQNEQGETVASSQDQASGVNPEGLDIRGIINRGLPPCSESGNATPKMINDFFLYWRELNKKWKYALIAIIALIVCAFSIKSCSNIIDRIFTLASEQYVPDAPNDGEDITPSLSVESIQLTVKGQSTTIEIKNCTSTAVWKSSNPDVATVDNGKVTAISNGRSTVEATIGGQLVGRCEVLVTLEGDDSAAETDDDEGMTDSDNAGGNSALIDTTKTYKNSREGSIKIGMQFVIPIIKTGNPKVTFCSSNMDVATIDNNGTVTAKSKGTTKIDILCNGKKTDIFTLKVTEK